MTNVRNDVLVVHGDTPLRGEVRVKGAKNLENARKFYDWALTPAAQKIGAETKNYQVPSNKSVAPSPGAPKMDEIKLINYDFAKYGSSAERKRLLERWEREVNSQPK